MNIVEIWTTFTVEGLHCYAQAGTDPALADVRYLSSPHRHRFGFRVSLQVFHDDRDVELHQFQRWMRSHLSPEPMNFEQRSCETIARELHAVIAQRYPGRAITIEVSEDGENGVTARYDAEGVPA